MEFFIPDPDNKPQLPREDVVRQLHVCKHSTFRLLPPNRDASELEVGLSRGGKYFTREPMGGNTDVTHWSPAAGKVACKLCWKAERTDNEVFNFATNRSEKE